MLTTTRPSRVADGRRVAEPSAVVPAGPPAEAAGGRAGRGAAAGEHYTRGVTSASTPELEADRQALIRLISDEAVFHGDFTLSSGKKATYYVDMRKLTLDHRAAPAIGRLVLDLVKDLDGVVAVGGLTLGADPIANAVMHESVHAGRPLDAFVVRKEPKDHGRGRQIEGADVAGKRVVVVEDTSTTGQSALKAVEALRREGAEVVAVAVIVDRKTGAQAAIEAEGLQWLASIDLDDLGLQPQ